MRYAWDLSHQYLKETNLDKGILGWGAKKILHYLRIWDSTTANRVDYFIANSSHIAKRIKKIYGRESTVIYPPVDINKFECSTVKENFYLTASRMVPYKRIDLIVEAFSQMPDKKLVVAGTGPEFDKIKSKAGSNVDILGYIADNELKNYMQKAKAFIFAAEEDFGIIVVEALACGTPVLAYGRGGTTETVFDGENGILFDMQTTDAVKNAVARFEQVKNKFDQAAISQKAKKFSREVFEQSINQFVDNKISEFFRIKTG
jgi:glycosyltransferase involved in cell wall biosynthesis